MSRRRVPRHPFDGESAILWGQRSSLTGQQAESIEANYRWIMKQRDKERSKVLAPGFQRGDDSWLEKAECRPGNGADPETFFPMTNQHKIERKWEDHCDVCPVFDQCAALKEEHPEWQGVWAGVYYPGPLLTEGLRGAAGHVTGRLAGRPRGNYPEGSPQARRQARRDAKLAAYLDEQAEAEGPLAGGVPLVTFLAASHG